MADSAVSAHMNGIIDEVDSIWDSFNALHRCSLEMRSIIKDYAIPSGKSMKAEEIDLESNFKSYEGSHVRLLEKLEKLFGVVEGAPLRRARSPKASRLGALHVDKIKREVEVDSQTFGQSAALSKEFLDRLAEDVRNQIEELPVEHEGFGGLVASCDELIADYSKTICLFEDLDAKRRAKIAQLLELLEQAPPKDLDAQPLQRHLSIEGFRSPSGSVRASDRGRSRDRKDRPSALPDSGLKQPRRRASPSPGPVPGPAARPGPGSPDARRLQAAQDKVGKVLGLVKKFQGRVPRGDQEAGQQLHQISTDLKLVEAYLSPQTSSQQQPPQNADLSTSFLPAPRDSATLVSQLGQLRKEHAHLVRKCADRKATIKKLYAFMLEREKLVKKFSRSNQQLQAELARFTDTAREEMRDYEQRIRGFELRVEKLALAADLARNLLFGSGREPLGPAQVVRFRVEVARYLQDLRDRLGLQAPDPLAVLSACFDLCVRSKDAALANHFQRKTSNPAKPRPDRPQTLVFAAAHNEEHTLEEIRRLKEDKEKELKILREDLSPPLLRPAAPQEHARTKNRPSDPQPPALPQLLASLEADKAALQQQLAAQTAQASQQLEAARTSQQRLEAELQQQAVASQRLEARLEQAASHHRSELAESAEVISEQKKALESLKQLYEKDKASLISSVDKLQLELKRLQEDKTRALQEAQTQVLELQAQLDARTSADLTSHPELKLAGFEQARARPAGKSKAAPRLPEVISEVVQLEEDFDFGQFGSQPDYYQHPQETQAGQQATEEDAEERQVYGSQQRLGQSDAGEPGEGWSEAQFLQALHAIREELQRIASLKKAADEELEEIRKCVAEELSQILESTAQSVESLVSQLVEGYSNKIEVLQNRIQELEYLLEKSEVPQAMLDSEGPHSLLFGKHNTKPQTPSPDPLADSSAHEKRAAALEKALLEAQRQRQEEQQAWKREAKAAEAQFGELQAALGQARVELQAKEEQQQKKLRETAEVLAQTERLLAGKDSLLKAAQASAGQLDAQLRLATSQLAQTDKDKQQLLQSEAALKADLDLLRREKTAAVEESADLRAQALLLASKLAGFEQTLEAKTQQDRLLADTRKQSEETAARLRSELQLALKTAMDSKAQLQTLAVEKSALEQQLAKNKDTLQAELALSADKNARLAKEAADCEARAKQLESAHASTQEKLRTALASLKEQDAKLADLHKELAGLRAAKSTPQPSQSSKASAQDAKQERLAAENAELERKCRELEKELEEYDKEVGEKEEQFRAEFLAMEARLEETQRRNQQLEQMLGQHQPEDLEETDLIERLVARDNLGGFDQLAEVGGLQPLVPGHPAQQPPQAPDSFEGGHRVETENQDFGDPQELMNSEFSRLFLNNVFLKKINTTLRDRLLVSNLKFAKARLNQNKPRRLEIENQSLKQELLDLTKKYMASEIRKSELEDRLLLRENQLEEAKSLNEERIKRDGSRLKEDLKHPTFDLLSNYFQEVLAMLKNIFSFEFPPFDDLQNATEWDAFKKKLKMSIREDKQAKADLQDNINSYKQMLNDKCIEVDLLQEKQTGATAFKGFFDKEANLSDIIAAEKVLAVGSLINDSDFKYDEPDVAKKDPLLNVSQEFISKQDADIIKERIAEVETENATIRREAERQIEAFRRDNDTLRMDNELLMMKNRELERENDELERTEDLLITQINTQKNEIENMRKIIKSTNIDSTKQNIKSSLLNWFDSMAKNKKNEAVAIYTVLQTQLELKPNEKADLMSILEKLKLKKKTS